MPLDFNMMGLMDPRNQGLLTAGASLLQAGGPSRTPVGFGSALGQGLLAGTQGYGQALNFQKQDVLTRLQMEKLKREIEQDEAFSNFIKGRSPGAPQAPGGGLTQLASAGGRSQGSADAVGAPWAANEPAQQFQVQGQQNPLSGPLPPEILPLMGTERGKGLLSYWQAANPDAKFEGGVPLNPKTGQPLPGVPTVPQTNQQGFSTFLKFNPATGQYEVNLTPGGMNAFQTQQGVAERTKAGFEPFMGVTDAQGRPIPMTRGQFADIYNPQPQAPGPQGLGADRTPQSDIVGFSPTEADALKRVQDASSKGQTAYVTVDPAKAGGMGPTPAQRSSAETMGKSDADRVTALETKLPSFLSASRRLDRMEALTKDNQTFAARGAELKKELGSLAQAFGLQVNVSKTANTEEYLAHVGELLKDRLGSKDYGSGTGISNLDILAAQGPLPELAKTAPGRLQLISAIRSDVQRNIKDVQSARDYFDANSGSLRGFRFPSEVAYEQNKLTQALPKEPGTPPSAMKVLKYNPTTKRIE